MTPNGNRQLNNNNTTGTTTIAGITSPGQNRNLVFAGDGNTTVGDITTGTGTLTKNNAGVLTLQGVNTYTGDTTVNTGGTLALVGGSQDSAITVNNGATLGFTLGSPTTSTKAVTLNTGHKIAVTGTPTLASYTLMTAASFDGDPPNLDPDITGYELVVDGTDLKLNFIGAGNPFDIWAAGFAGLTNPAPTLDFDAGGLATGIEWVLGGDPTNPADDATIAPTFNNSDPDSFVFTFNRRDDAENDPNTTIVVEYGSDLSGWDPATDGVDGVTIDDTAVPQAGFRTVVVSIPKTLAAGNKLFARLSIEVATP